MILAFYVVILILVVLLPALPLLRPAAEAELPAGSEPDAAAAVDQTFTALSEIEYDYQMNKLSEADYAELHTQYARKAIGQMQDLAEAPVAAEDDVAEAALLEAEAEAETEAEAQVAKKMVFCHHCGAKLMSPTQVYCHSCGLSLEEVSL